MEDFGRYGNLMLQLPFSVFELHTQCDESTFSKKLREPQNYFRLKLDLEI